MSEKVLFSHTGGEEIEEIVVRTESGNQYVFSDRQKDEEMRDTELVFGQTEVRDGKELSS